MIPTSGFEISRTAKQFLLVFMAFGLVVFLCGLFAAPERIWPNFLIAEYYFIGLGMGAVFFIAIQYVSNGGWAVGMRRIPEAMGSTLPIAGLGALVLIFGIHALYEWSHVAVVAEDPILRGKQAWLNEPFFIARLIGYFIIWVGLSRMILKNSQRQDDHADLAYTRRNVRNSALFILFGAYTFCLVSFDLLMSLQPHWYSTVFGFLNIAGMFLSSLAMIAIFIVLLRQAGYAHIFTTEHLQTVGNMILAFCTFWVYMWVSQHMLIWYSNIPEETSYYIFRHFGGWGTLSLVNVVLNWLIPFFVLLPRLSKRHDKTMLQVSIIVLLGHWLDLYIMVIPATSSEPSLNIWEIGPIVGTLALFFWLVFRRLGKFNLVPVNDPYLVESIPQQHASKEAIAGKI